MWIRGKVKHWTLHLHREFGRCSSLWFQSYSTSGRPLVYLSNPVTKAEICLVGVDHISSKSSAHVQHVIRHHEPNVVAVELCEGRARAIISGKKPTVKSWKDFFSMKGSFRERLFIYTITNLYAYIASKDDGPLPGDEMRVAMAEGMAMGAKILCMDKNFKVIASNVSRALSLRDFLYFIRDRKTLKQRYPNLHGAILTTDHAIHDYWKGELSMRELREQADAFFEPGVLEEHIALGNEYFPGLARALLHERNEHMVRRLRELEGVVVAVVGAAHVPGMRDLWQEGPS